MKTRILFVLAAAAMLFTACGKDEDTNQNDNNNGNNEPQEVVLEKNQLIYNGMKYNIESGYGSNGAMYFTYGNTLMESDTIPPVIGFQNEGYIEGLNKTFDLTKGPFEDGFCMWIYNNEDPSKNLYFFNNFGGWAYHFGEEWEEETQGTPFESGTLEVKINDTEFSYVLEGGKLKNGDTFEIYIYAPLER